MEDTFQEGQEKEEQPEEKGDIKAEDNAVEMTDDFDGQMHDGDGQEQGGRIGYYQTYLCGDQICIVVVINSFHAKIQYN